VVAAAWIQAIAAFGSLLVTGGLAWLTFNYVKLTQTTVHQASEIAKKAEEREEKHCQRMAYSMLKPAERLRDGVEQQKERFPWNALGGTWATWQEQSAQMVNLALDVGSGLPELALAVVDRLEAWRMSEAIHTEPDPGIRRAGEAQAGFALQEAIQMLDSLITAAKVVVKGDGKTHD
jgi:hypothetical protein